MNGAVASARLAPERTVVIVGMPRSGTSWLGQIVESCPEVRFRLSPIFSYALKNRVDESSTGAEWEALLRDAYGSDDAFMEQTEHRDAGRYPVFREKQAQPPVLAIKMTRFHNLLRSMFRHLDTMKMVAIVRHPCGAIHSWLTTPREFPPDADPAAEWRRGGCRKTAPEEFWGFEDWKRVTRLHLELERCHPDRFRIQRYEPLVEDAERETRELLAFLGLKCTAQTLAFVRDSQSRHIDHTHAVFKDPGVKDRWKSELDASIRDAILRELRDTELARFIR
jgi:hypothetical protein